MRYGLWLLFLAFFAGYAVRGLLDGCGVFASAGPC